MPTYKLIYFNTRGRAEISRYLFALGGIEYKDNRIDFANWPELKNSKSVNKLTDEICHAIWSTAVLEIDGVKIPQTIAIARLIAKRSGLLGKGDIQKALADSIVLAVDDMFMAMVDIFREKDEDKKAGLQKKFVDETAPDTLSKLEKIISDNSSGYFVGDELTWADVVVFDLMGWICGRTLPDDYFSKYPQILALESKIMSLPQIDSWLAKRPESIF